MWRQGKQGEKGPKMTANWVGDGRAGARLGGNELRIEPPGFKGTFVM